MLRDEQKFRQLWAIHAQVRHHIPTSTLGWLFVFSLCGGHINFRDQRWMQVNLGNQRLAPVKAKRKSDESVPKGREWRDWIVLHTSCLLILVVMYYSSQIFSSLPNLGPKIHGNFGILKLKSTREIRKKFSQRIWPGEFEPKHAGFGTWQHRTREVKKGGGFFFGS